MTPKQRLRLIAARQRLRDRAEGKPTSLTLSEMKEIGPRLLAGEDVYDLAREYGVSPRRIRRVRVNRLVASGMFTDELSKWQRDPLRGL